MKHLVDDHRVRRAGRKRQRIHVALPKLGRIEPRLGELDPGKAEHLRRAIDAEGMIGRRREQLKHPPGARPDIDQPAHRRIAERARDRGLHLALGDMERAKRIPMFGLAREIALGCGRAIGAHCREPRRIGRDPRILAVDLGPALQQMEEWLDPLAAAEPDEDPASFLAPFGKPRFDHDSDMARHARLALAEHLRDLADGQLHRAQQHHDPKPGRIGERGEKTGLGKHICGYKDIFISVKRHIANCIGRETMDLDRCID